MSEGVPVLDASAFLAYIQAEPGAEVVQQVLGHGCCISAVNWAEVVSKVAELGKPSHEFVAELKQHQLLGTSLQIVPFNEEDAPLVGDMRPLTRPLGLSLGDRACIALGHRLGSPVFTADRAWGELEADLKVEIRMIRQRSQEES